MFFVTAALCAPSPSALHEAAWELLFRALSEHCGISREMAVFSKNEHGKPRLISHGGIEFSLAHGKDCAVCVLADEPVGIDCEKRRPVSARLKVRMLGLSADSDDTEALRRWTRLESYAKYRGEGVYGMTYEKDIEKTADATCRFEDYSDLLGEEYIITVCRPRS